MLWDQISSEAELSGFPATGGDVDGTVASQGVLYMLVDEQPPDRDDQRVTHWKVLMGDYQDHR